LASVDLLIGRDVHETQWHKRDEALQTTLDPPLNLSEASYFTLRLHYRRHIGPLTLQRRHKDIAVDAGELLSGVGLDGNGKRGTFLTTLKELLTFLTDD